MPLLDILDLQIGLNKPGMLAITHALRASSAPIRAQFRLSSASALAAARWSGGAPLDGATWAAPADAGATPPPGLARVGRSAEPRGSYPGTRGRSGRSVGDDR